MSKFKVGDAVVPSGHDRHDLFGHWMMYWAEDGDACPTKFYVVGFSEDGEYVIYNAKRTATDGPHIYPRDLKLAPYTSCAAAEVDNLAAEYGGGKREFKVGDRVRYTGKRKLGFDSDMIGRVGTVTKNEGVCVGVDWDGSPVWSYGVYPDNLEHVAVTTATATAIRIEAGKFYKTRDGRKVGPMDYRGYDDEHPWGGHVANDGAYYIFEFNGINYIPGANDLVAECTDVTSIADIVAKHSQTGTAIVCLLENGKPKPATEPFVHGDAKTASTEASRLANVHKGKEFGVYTLGEVRKVEKTFEHEWQRLAYGGRKIEAIRELRGKTGLFLATAKDAVEDWLKRAA